MEPTSGPERVSRRLREQFAPVYLAITGLVQVLVLDALVTKVEGGYAPLALATRHRCRGALAVAVTAFGLLGWALYDLLSLGSAELAVAAAALAGVVAIIASSVPMWNQILRYARGR
jgi:hypothetical protein